MAKHDEWCELCNDKIKVCVIIIKDRELEICSHCKDLILEFK